MKKLSLLVLLSMLLLVILTACGGKSNGGKKECKHVDADDNLICDKCEEAFDDGCDNHRDANDDGTCDVNGCNEAYDDGHEVHVDADDNGVCDFDGCDEEYEDGCDNHVDADDDGNCDVDGCDEAYEDGCDNHRDADDNGVCDVDGCDVAYEDAHEVHVDANDDLVCDTLGCTETCDDGHDYHYDRDDDLVCDVDGCGEACDDGEDVVDVTGDTLEEAIARILAEAHRVKYGTTASDHWNSGMTRYTTSGHFSLDDGYCYIYNDSFLNPHTWYMISENGNVLSIVSGEDDASGIRTNPDEFSADSVQGYRFEGDTVNYILDSTIYGVENFVQKLYVFATENGFGFEDLSKDGTFAFSFAKLSYANELGIYVIEFTLDDTGFLATLNVEFNEYANGFEIVYLTDDNGDPVLDTDGNHVPASYTLSDGASVQKTHTSEYTQDDEYSHTAEEILGQDALKKFIGGYTLSYNGVTLDPTKPFEMEIDKEYLFTVEGLSPNTADFSFDVPKIYDEEGNMIWAYDAYLKVTNDGKFSFKLTSSTTMFREGETYYLTIRTGDFTYDFNIKVPVPPVTEMSPVVEDADGKVLTGNIQAVIDDLIFISASVNAGANNAFTAEITSDNADGAILTELNGEYEFVGIEEGTYVITLTSVDNPAITTTVTIAVVAEAPVVPDGPSIVAGTYTGTSGNETLVVIVNEDGTIIFRHILNAGTDEEEMIEVNYTYTISNGVVTLTNTETGSAIDPNNFMAIYFGKLVVDDNFVPVSANYGNKGNTFTFASQEPEIEAEDLTIGNNQIKAEDVVWSYTAVADGTLTLNVGPAIMGAVTVTYSVNGGEAVTLEVDVAAVLKLAAGDEVIINVTAEGYATLDAAWAVDETPAAPELVVGPNTIPVTDADIEVGGITYTINVTEAGNYTFASQNLLVRVVVNGIPATGMAYLEAGTYEVQIVTAYISAAGNYTVTVTTDGGDEGGDEGEDVQAENLTIGNNQINAEDVVWSYTAAADGTLTLNVGNAIMGDVTVTYSVNGGEAVTLEANVAAEIALVAGDKVVINVTAAGYATLNAAWAVAPAEDNSTPISVGNNSINAEDVVWSYTAAADGTLTLNVGTAIMGAVTVTYSVNGGEAVTLEVDVAAEIALVAGDKVIINVTAAGYATLNAAWAAAAAEDNSDPLNIGNNQIDAEDVVWSYTAAADGTLTLNVGNAIMGAVTVTYSVNGGEAVTLEATVAAEVALVAGDKVVINVTAAGYATLNAAWAGAAAEDNSTPISAGNNAINAKDEVWSYTAEANGTLTLNVGNAIMGAVTVTYSVNGGEAVTLEANVAAVLELAAGDKVIINVTAAGYATLNLAWAKITTGAQDDPHVLDPIPSEVTFTSDINNKVFYLITATENCTITFTWPTADSWYEMTELNANGENTANGTSGYMSESFSFELKAGTTYRVGLCTWEIAGEVTVTITTAPAEDGGDEGGDEGGDTTLAPSGSYLGSSGRNYRVVIDLAAGTMTVTRSDMTGNFTGGATVNEYTFSIVDGEPVYELVTKGITSGDVILTFDENCVPTHITCGTQSCDLALEA